MMQTKVESHGFNNAVILKSYSSLVTRGINIFVAPRYQADAFMEVLRKRVIKGKLQYGIVDKRFVCQQTHAAGAEIESISKSGKMGNNCA